MTLALDQAQPANLPLVRRPRMLLALRRWLAAVCAQWAEECAEPADTLSTLTVRDWADLPTWHPAADPE